MKKQRLADGCGREARTMRKEVHKVFIAFAAVSVPVAAGGAVACGSALQPAGTGGAASFGFFFLQVWRRFLPAQAGQPLCVS